MDTREILLGYFDAVSVKDGKIASSTIFFDTKAFHDFVTQA